MLDKITFERYKAFNDKQELELKPITILIGKNSSGKSAIAKLPTLIEHSLSGTFEEPLQLEIPVYNKMVKFGVEFSDLIYGRSRTESLEIGIEQATEKLTISINSERATAEGEKPPEIFDWKYTSSIGKEITKGRNDTFRGFINTETTIENLSLKTDYIGPFRILPKRHYEPVISSPKKVGIDGYQAYEMLIKDGGTADKLLLNKVSNWYQASFEDWGVKIIRNGSQYDIELFRADIAINFCDVGEGMSQVLPLVVRAFQPVEEETLIIIEQPELHLHPAAHGGLAELFATNLQEGKKRYLIETHSQNFVLRLRRLVAEGKINKEQLKIYYVDFQEKENFSVLKEIKVDDYGRVDYWPENIFSETLTETIALRNAQLNQERNVD